MKNNLPKNIPTLTGLFGLRVWHNTPCLRPSKKSILIKDGWFQLRIGTDSKGAEFLAVFTKQDGFVLSTMTAALAPRRTRQKRTGWIFLVDDLRSDFFDYGRAKFVDYGDFKVTYGLDDCQREFLYVGLPKQELQFLIRNPASLPAGSSNEREAIVVFDQMTTKKIVPAKQAIAAKPLESTGDADLDAILGLLN